MNWIKSILQHPSLKMLIKVWFESLIYFIHSSFTVLFLTKCMKEQSITNPNALL